MDKDIIDPYITKNLPAFSLETGIDTVIEELSKKPKRWGSLDYVFVTSNYQLAGIVSIEDLFASNRSLTLKNIMKTDFQSISPGTDKEKAVILAIQKNIYAVPVIDNQGKFIGIVEPHNLLKILHEENTEDFLASAGIAQPELKIVDTLKLRVVQLIRYRLPWLILGLTGGIIATAVVSFFEDALEKQLALAFFIPVIVYMSDAVGTQTETIFIRAIYLRTVNTRKYLLKEILVGLNIGLVIGIIVFTFAFFWLNSLEMALIVSLAMLANITLAMVIAVIIPYSLFKLKKDPALGSGPFATAVQDIVSLLIYFGVAVAILTAFAK